MNVHCPTKTELSILTKQIDLLPVCWWFCLFVFVYLLFSVEGSKLKHPDRKRGVEWHY